MNVVFAITCHRLTAPLLHTVEYLSSFKGNTILIHVDKKIDIKSFLILEKSNVFLIPNRVEVTWGSASQIESMLELMRFSLKFQYEFFFLLSGDDIPLKTNAELKSFLNTFFDYNFIGFDQKMTYEVIEGRVKYSYPSVFYQRNAKLPTKIIRKFLSITKNVLLKNKSFERNRYRMPRLYLGANWFGLKIDAIKYILDYVEYNDWYLKLFDASHCADEIFFHTIIKTNPEIKLFDHPNYPISSLRYIDWSAPVSPKVLGEEDIPKMKSSNCFFARKIDANASPEFMNTFLIECDSYTRN